MINLISLVFLSPSPLTKNLKETKEIWGILSNKRIKVIRKMKGTAAEKHKGKQTLFEMEDSST